MRSRLILSVLTLIPLAVLIGLGTWQVQRLHWKNALTAKIEKRLSAPPLSLAEVLALRQKDKDVEYRPISITGTFDHTRAIRVYALNDGRAGWHIYAPLRTTSGKSVLVNRGFVPAPLDGSNLPLVEPQGSVTVIGLARMPPSSTSLFTPKNEPAKRQFYWRDFTNMVSAIHDKTAVSFAPLFIDQTADQTAPSSRWPQPGVTRVNLSNRHLEYAITWYGLALALVGVYGFFIYGTRRRRAIGSDDT